MPFRDRALKSLKSYGAVSKSGQFIPKPHPNQILKSPSKGGKSPSKGGLDWI
jgi:hypothetical protein